MSKAPSATTRKEALVALHAISYDAAFDFRANGIETTHKADLASIIRNTGKALDPVTLWRDGRQSGAGKLTLLDGAHRIEAYRAVGWAEPIPAIIYECDRKTALANALSGNSRRTLQLTQAERMDAAWRLVRELVEPRFTVKEIVAAAGVSQRNVKYMRSRFRTMHEEGTEITGQWHRDRTSQEQADDPAGMLSDVQRRAGIHELVKDFRDMLDRRKHPERLILRDAHAVEEAIVEAVGEKRFKQMIEYHLGEEAEADEWLNFARDAHSPAAIALDDDAVNTDF
jgi:hypothetical protein